MWMDIRHGFVLLRRAASVSTLIISVLALGIGGNAAIFTLLKAAFLDPLPYRDAGRVVTIMENNGWIPQTLLINGHNQLTLLHSALSEGLHDQTDEKCLELATSIRVVLTDLADRLGCAQRPRWAQYRCEHATKVEYFKASREAPRDRARPCPTNRYP